MEEIITKFTHFLDCVWNAESEADQFKMKLLLKPGAKVKLFTQIDTSCNGQITAHDIQTFCQSVVRGNSWTTQIIGRYFKNWQEGITFNQFFDVMKPMNTQLYQEQLVQQTETTLFIKLVENIVVNFNNLQLLRKQLSMNSAKIIKYFSQNYGSAKTITKEHLKIYMIDHCTNAQQKFELVLKYMYGNQQQQIPWQIFFNTKIDDTECEIKPITMTHRQKQKIQVNSEKSPSYQNMPKLCENQNQNLEQVLSQIQQIEQSMKAKKLNLKSQNIPICNQQKQNYRQSLIGKVVPLKKHFQQTNIGFRTKEQNYHESYTKRRDMIGSPKIGMRNLKKCESQAQLKIKQIQRRAMDKYLHKHAQLQSTNNLYYPPYYIQSFCSSPRQIQEKAYHRIPYFQNRTTITANIHKINLRNKEKDYYWRPVSPRLLRY